MKVLQLGKAYPPVNLGGVESTIELITEGLHQKDVTCDVLGVNGEFSSVKEIRPKGIIYRSALIKKAFSTLFSIDLIFRLFKIHKQYDIIHLHHPDPMCAIALWLTNPHCKIVLHWHSDILKQKTLLKLFMPIQTWLLERADIIIATSPNYAESSIYLMPFLYKVEIVPIGIDKSKLSYDDKIIEQIDKKYHSKKKLLAIGRMTYYKGYEYLIDSLRVLDDSYILFIIGNGELEATFKTKVHALGLEGKVVFLGKVNDIERNSYLKKCDVFVLSSIFKTEAFAIVQVEAMAFGKPVVSTIIDGSGVDWVNKNMASGLTVSTRNHNSIALAINKIMGDKSLYNLLSKGAIERFNEEFTQEIMAQRIINIYKKVLYQ